MAKCNLKRYCEESRAYMQYEITLLIWYETDRLSMPTPRKNDRRSRTNKQTSIGLYSRMKSSGR